MYGSKVDSQGNEISSDSSFVSPVVGERVKGNKLVSIGMATDKDGNALENRATVEFQQQNGSKVRWTIFEANEDYQFDNINKNVKHLATKFMSEEEYYAGLEEGGMPKDFVDFINKIAKIILPKAKDKVVTMKFVYINGYVTVPKFPNWIALPENEDTLSTNAKYDKYTPEEATKANKAEQAASSNVF